MFQTSRHRSQTQSNDFFLILIDTFRLQAAPP